MTAAVTYLPNIAEACDRISAREAEARMERDRAAGLNAARIVLRFPDSFAISDVADAWEVLVICADRSECLDYARSLIDKPTGLPDAVLRAVCGFFMTYGDGGVHYLRADEHIAAINQREWRARNCPRHETPAQIVRKHLRRWPEVMAGATALAGIMITLGGWW